MAPQGQVSLMALEIEYCEELHPEHPEISDPDINPIHGFSQRVHQWFNCSMKEELLRIPEDFAMDFGLWRIKTGDADLFQLGTYKFNKVIVIVGEDTIYFMYIQESGSPKYLEGHRTLVDSTCSCCFDKQYLNVMKSIKAFVENEFSKQGIRAILVIN